MKYELYTTDSYFRTMGDVCFEIVENKTISSNFSDFIRRFELVSIKRGERVLVDDCSYLVSIQPYIRDAIIENKYSTEVIIEHTKEANWSWDVNYDAWIDRYLREKTHLGPEYRHIEYIMNKDGTISQYMFKHNMEKFIKKLEGMGRFDLVLKLVW